MDLAGFGPDIFWVYRGATPYLQTFYQVKLQVQTNGRSGWTRTIGNRIMNAVLYQLSYGAARKSYPKGYKRKEKGEDCTLSGTNYRQASFAIGNIYVSGGERRLTYDQAANCLLRIGRHGMRQANTGIVYKVNDFVHKMGSFGRTRTYDPLFKRELL